MNQRQTFQVQANQPQPETETHWQLQALALGQRKAINKLQAAERDGAREALKRTEVELSNLKAPIQASSSDAGTADYAIAALTAELEILRAHGSNPVANNMLIEQIRTIKAYNPSTR